MCVGVLDILKPLLFAVARGGSATRVLQSIASGALGREAYQEGSREACPSSSRVLSSSVRFTGSRCTASCSSS